MALWVEKHHGADGMIFIAEKIGGFVLNGEQGGVELWRGVASRFDELLRSKTGHCAS